MGAAVNMTSAQRQEFIEYVHDQEVVKHTLREPVESSRPLHSIEMQRTIEGLVEVGDQAQSEAARCRHGEAADISAAREAQERGDPSVRTL
jgi:hypothetical protein